MRVVEVVLDCHSKERSVFVFLHYNLAVRHGSRGVLAEEQARRKLKRLAVSLVWYVIQQKWRGGVRGGRRYEGMVAGACGGRRSYYIGRPSGASLGLGLLVQQVKQM